VLVLTCHAAAAAATTVALESTIWSHANPANLSDDELLQVHFIDVGGGDGIIVMTPAGKTILIDGGFTWSDRGRTRPEYQAYLDHFLEDAPIDLIIISHPDYDHFGGLDDVVENRTVRQIWYNGYDSPELSQSWSYLEADIEDDDAAFLSPLGAFFELGTVVRFDDMETDDGADDVVLTLVNSQQWITRHAYGSGRTMNEAKRRNSSSIVVRMDYGDASFLFTGDTNGRAKNDDEDECDDQEMFMVDNHNNTDHPLHGSLDVDVLKVAHHGSNGSSNLCFLEAASPTWAVVPAGHPHGHPDQGVIDRLQHANVGLDGAHILRTDDGDSGGANEANLGDDCYIFYCSPDGVMKIEKWEVTID